MYGHMLIRIFLLKADLETDAALPDIPRSWRAVAGWIGRFLKPN